MKSAYTKQPITVKDQLAILRNRGLSISNEQFAEEQLRKISYFRLACYWRPMEQDKVRHVFKKGSKFEDVMQLYHFDKALRHLVFGAVQTIEIALRSKIIQHVSLKYGAFWFSDSNLFANLSIYSKCFDSLKDEMRRSKEDFLAEHFAKYDTPPYPPAWKILEVASLGTTAKLYANLKDVKLKKQIAREFGLPQHLFLESWMKSVAALRNCVAHHARIWNRKFPMMPQMPTSLNLPWMNTCGVSRERLYATLCILQYLLNALGEGRTFKDELKNLLKASPNVDIAAMGFPKDWKQEPLWIV